MQRSPLAINSHASFGRWAFVEVRDPWDCQDALRAAWEDHSA